jgi:hypothetical protein
MESLLSTGWSLPGVCFVCGLLLAKTIVTVVGKFIDSSHDTRAIRVLTKHYIRIGCNPCEALEKAREDVFGSRSIVTANGGRPAHPVAEPRGRGIVKRLVSRLVSALIRLLL